MNKFLVILSDMNGSPDYKHPSEINGKIKDEIKNLLKEDVPEENIVAIFTEDEYIQFINSKKFKAITSGNYMDEDPGDGNKFLDNMIQKANAVASALEEDNSIQANNYNVSSNVSSSQPIDNNINNVTYNNLNNISPKYFIDNGIQFKLENGQLYKKVWKSVQIEEYMNDEGQKVFPEFRIVNKETGKPIKSSKYDVQQLVWQLLENH